MMRAGLARFATYAKRYAWRLLRPVGLLTLIGGAAALGFWHQAVLGAAEEVPQRYLVAAGGALFALLIALPFVPRSTRVTLHDRIQATATIAMTIIAAGAGAFLFLEQEARNEESIARAWTLLHLARERAAHEAERILAAPARCRAFLEARNVDPGTVEHCLEPQNAAPDQHALLTRAVELGTRRGAFGQISALQSLVRRHEPLQGIDLAGFNLRRLGLSHVFLPDADLAGADLTFANLSRAYLARADFRGANLMLTNLSDAHLGNADLRDARLIGTNLRGADLSGANLAGADLFTARLMGADLKGANLRGAALVGARFWNTRVGSAWFPSVLLTPEQIGGLCRGRAPGGEPLPPPDGIHAEIAIDCGD